MSVDTERLGRVLLITMRREHKRNAIDASITAGLAPRRDESGARGARTGRLATNAAFG